MDNILFSLGVVMPLFLMMALGFAIRRIKLADGNFFSTANNVCFKVLLPLMIFENLYTSDLESVFDIKLILFCVIAVFVLAVVLMLVVPLFIKDNSRRGVMIQGMFRSNFLLFGVPLVRSLSGDEGVALVSMLIVVIIPLFNALAVISLALFQTENGKRYSVWGVVKGILTNPLIISSAIAVATVLLGIKLPEFIEKAISSVAAIATPLSLIVLGGEFNVGSVKSCIFHTMIGVAVKLAVVPAIMLPIAVGFGFRGTALCAVLTLFASPVAVSSYVMAKTGGGDGDLAANLLIFSTLFSSVSIFFIVLIMRSLGYI